MGMMEWIEYDGIRVFSGLGGVKSQELARAWMLAKPWDRFNHCWDRVIYPPATRKILLHKFNFILLLFISYSTNYFLQSVATCNNIFKLILWNYHIHHKFPLLFFTAFLSPSTNVVNNYCNPIIVSKYVN